MCTTETIANIKQKMLTPHESMKNLKGVTSSTDYYFFLVEFSKASFWRRGEGERGLYSCFSNVFDLYSPTKPTTSKVHYFLFTK